MVRARRRDGLRDGHPERSRARGRARRAARLAKADLTTRWSASSRSCRASWAGSTCRPRGHARPTWRRPCAGTTTRSRSRPRQRPAAVFARRRRTRVRRGVAGRQARHPGRLLRPRPRAHGQQRSLRPAPRRPGRRCARSSTSGSRRGGAAARACDALVAAAAVAGYGAALKRPAAEVRSDLEAFLLDRLRYVLAARGFPADEVEAVLAAPRARRPRRSDASAWPRLAALHRVRRRPARTSSALAVAFKRAKNILGEHGARGAVEPRAVRASRRGARAARARSRGLGLAERRLRGAAARRWRGCARPVDRFFDDVLVMAEDPQGAGEPPRPARTRPSRSSTASRTFRSSEDKRDLSTSTSSAAARPTATRT